jgi:dTDP-4-amino-4,6-dideoxygalactose transaminase
MVIPFVDLKTQYLSIKPEIDNAIFSTINNTSFIGGESVLNFEKSFEKIYNVNHCISCANGTDSLYIIMKMLGIGPGDEVITVANSWISSSETITQVGAKVVFVDCDPNFYTIDVSKIEEKITLNTKAILPVHLFGQACDIDNLLKIAKKHKLFVIEDCAQSHFTVYNGKFVGTYGDAASFSFYPGKNLGAYGDAGAMITNNQELSLKLKMYARHGALIKHQHHIEGVNSRLDGIQAAILNVKLSKILEWTEKRKYNANYLTNLLIDIPQIITPKIRPNTEHTFHLYVIQSQNRDQLMNFLKLNGIETLIHYPTPLPFLKAYNYLNSKSKDFPVTVDLSHKILSLPMYPEINEAQLNFIADKIKEFYKHG